MYELSLVAQDSTKGNAATGLQIFLDSELAWNSTFGAIFPCKGIRKMGVVHPRPPFFWWGASYIRRFLEAQAVLQRHGHSELAARRRRGSQAARGNSAARSVWQARALRAASARLRGGFGGEGFHSAMAYGSKVVTNQGLRDFQRWASHFLFGRDAQG